MDPIKKDTRGLVVLLVVVAVIFFVVGLFNPLWKWVWSGPLLLAMVVYWYDRTISK